MKTIEKITKKILPLVFTGIMALSGNVFGQNNLDSLKLKTQQNEQARKDLIEFIKKNGKVNYDSGIKCSVYQKGCKDRDECQDFYNAHFFENNTLVLHLHIPDSITNEGKIHSQKRYYINDKGSDGLGENDIYGSFKETSLGTRISSFYPANISEIIGESIIGSYLKSLSDKDKQKARKDYYFVIKEILHNTKVEEY